MYCVRLQIPSHGRRMKYSKSNGNNNSHGIFIWTGGKEHIGFVCMEQQHRRYAHNIATLIQNWLEANKTRFVSFFFSFLFVVVVFVFQFVCIIGRNNKKQKRRSRGRRRRRLRILLQLSRIWIMIQLVLISMYFCLNLGFLLLQIVCLAMYACYVCAFLLCLHYNLVEVSFVCERPS